jgi:hypothetical protein
MLMSQLKLKHRLRLKLRPDLNSPFFRVPP